MVQLPSAFDPSQHQGVTDFEAIPADWYLSKIVDSEMKQTSNQNGYYLQLVWEIMQGDYAKRKVFQRLNLVNPSTQAVEIANKFLKSICEATSTPGPVTDSTVLHEKPCMIKVTQTKPTAQYAAGNDVKAYKMADGSKLPSEGGTSAAANPVAAATAAAAPVAPVADPAPATVAANVAAATPAPAEGKKKPPWVK